MWGFIAALISGALMSIQGVFNTEVTKQTSLWVSTGWVQLSAFVVCVLAWLFTGRESIAALWQVDNKYTLLGGVIGAFITITVIQSMGALGPAKAAMLIVISQLAVAYIIELLGIFGVDNLILNHGEFDGIGLAVGGEGVLAVKLYVLPLVYTQLVFVYGCCYAVLELAGSIALFKGEYHSAQALAAA